MKVVGFAHGASAREPILTRRGCGKITRRAKLRLRRRANQRYKLAPSFPLQEGRSRVVTNVGEDAVDVAASARKVIAGRGQTRERFMACRTNDAKAYGKTVWFRHPLLVSSCRWLIRSNRIEEPSSRQRR